MSAFWKTSSPQRPQRINTAQSTTTLPDSAYSRVPNTPSRRRTHPGFHASRRKRRRWPLVLRITKGSVHVEILLPVLFHCLWTALLAWIDLGDTNFGLPASIVPSLSIVVGLMLVFRNGTSYDRFWSGRNSLTTILVAVRSLTRYFVVYCKDDEGHASEAERQDTERIVRILIALLYSIKHTLRHEYVGITAAPTSLPFTRTPGSVTPNDTLSNSAIFDITMPVETSYGDVPRSTSTTSFRAPVADSIATLYPVYTGLLPPDMPSLEDQGLALPLQLAMPIEAYIRKGTVRKWWAAPQASYLSAQLTTALQAFSQMDTIRSTPLPIAHLIHARQVLALYLMVLPFALVEELGWWSIPIMILLAFTLYGIEAIGSQLEDPFGYDRNDIKMDAIVEDARVECAVLLEEWRMGGGWSGS